MHVSAAVCVKADLFLCDIYTRFLVDTQMSCWHGDPQGAVEARNANYAAVVRHLQFRKRAWLGLHLANAHDEDRQLRSGDDGDSDTSEAAEGLEDAEQVGPASSGAMQMALQERAMMYLALLSNMPADRLAASCTHKELRQCCRGRACVMRRW